GERGDTFEVFVQLRPAERNDRRRQPGDRVPRPRVPRRRPLGDPGEGMMRSAVWVLVALLIAWPSTTPAEGAWSADHSDGALRMRWDGKPVARYVYNDPVIARPYFADLCAPSGVQVTRTHPPVAGADRMYHPEFHPGAWLAFG